MGTNIPKEYDWFRVIPEDFPYHRCYVGSGECKNRATHTTDDGCGNVVYVCAHHVEEMEAWEKIIAELAPETLKAFTAAVEEAHKKL